MTEAQNTTRVTTAPVVRKPRSRAATQAFYHQD